MKGKWLCPTLAAVLALSAGILGACAPDGETSGDSGNYVLPTWKDVPEGWDGKDNLAMVHDPSVFFDEASGTYYAFGTHYAVASSKDLMAWTQEVEDYHPEDLYGDGTETSFPSALSATVSLVSPVSSGENAVTSTWAPDVTYHDGKYYMYYSLTKAFGSAESAIGRVSSENVLGPYSDNEPVIDSMGNTDKHDPNCIDPELFTDKDGKLWMVYGSAAGGIYLLELENSGENWGLPKAGQGFGKKLWSGTNNQEGPFIFYNEDTGYYYLMVSYGDLNTNYNMRVARSKTPDGPYLDITGADVAKATGDGGGNKIAGNYVMGDKTKGYAALGHNSVIEKDGQFFVAAHVRRQSGGTGVSPGHNLYVFRLYFNKDGWPVMSPERYATEKPGKGLTAEKLAGEYDVVEHTEGTTATFAQSVSCTFNADGTVTDGADAKVGTWTLTDGQYVTVTLGSVTYEGVAAPAYDSLYEADEGAMHPAFVFTAVSAAGRSLWAVGTFEAQPASAE